MGFFNKHYWEPLICKPEDIIELMQECIAINAPLVRLVIQQNETEYEIGVICDMDRYGTPFDILFYLGEQEYETLDAFCQGAVIDGVQFMKLETITVLREEEAGDPRNNVLLQKREIKHYAVTLNIHYTIPDHLWMKILPLVKELNAAGIVHSVEPGGLQLCGTMTQSQWDGLMQNFCEKASVILGFAVGDANGEYPCIPFV